MSYHDYGCSKFMKSSLDRLVKTLEKEITKKL